MALKTFMQRFTSRNAKHEIALQSVLHQNSFASTKEHHGMKRKWKQMEWMTTGMRLLGFMKDNY